MGHRSPAKRISRILSNVLGQLLQCLVPKRHKGKRLLCEFHYTKPPVFLYYKTYYLLSYSTTNSFCFIPVARLEVRISLARTLPTTLFALRRQSVRIAPRLCLLVEFGFLAWDLRRGGFQRGWLQTTSYCKLRLRCNSGVCHVALSEI